MYKNIFLWLAICAASISTLAAQVKSFETDTIYKPNVSYQKPIHKVIAAIEVEGAEDLSEYLLYNISGLNVGDEILIPGPAITNAVNRFMRQGLYSDVKIFADKYVGNKAYLRILLKKRPRISTVTYTGVKKTEREELELKTGLKPGLQMTANAEDRVKQLVQKYYSEKGYRNMDMNVVQEPDLSKEGFVHVIVNINKKGKTRVNRIFIEGNEALSDYKLKMAMKKTNEKFSLSKGRTLSSILKIFSTKKFVEDEYQNDLNLLLARYHEAGYRDAEIVSDSFVPIPGSDRVNVRLKINEGKRYYIKDIKFVGNTKYPASVLEKTLGMKTGDVYDQKRLAKRLSEDEDAVSNLYYNSGYIFSWLDPVETNVVGDSVSLDIRISEGKPATIDRIIIKGNTIVYDEVVRRELYTKPGQLFSREDIMNSYRLINQLGHFDAEKSQPRPIPNQETGTVDIEYDLVPKSSDQLELSVGWGQTGLIARVGVKFTNFSIRNLLHPSMYKGIIPQGDGQTLSINGQTNGKYYQQYGISFMDPWFGGKRPNMFSVSAFYSKMTAIDTKYYNSNANAIYNSYYNPYFNSAYGYGGMGGLGGGGMGYAGGQMSDLYEKATDPDRSLQMIGTSIGYGKRLSWPDNWFQIYGSLNYTFYKLRNWTYSTFQNFHHGVANDINFELRLSRNSTDNPIYPRGGSEFMVSVAATPPYSLFDKKDYSNPLLPESDRYRFIEYHKWRFKARVFTPLLSPNFHKHTPVIMGRIEGGIIGSYNDHKRSPFGTYYMGGDGMSSSVGGYMNETIGLRGYRNGSIAGNNYNYAYSYMRMTMELRYPLLFENATTIWAQAFIEAGNAWRDNQTFNPFNLKRSAGVGLRVMLPMVGLLGIDWAYGFDKPDGSNQRGGSNIHFILGQEF